MLTNKVSPSEITSRKERFQVMDSGNPLNTWEDWTNYYQANICTPPVVFNIRDSFPVDFSDPVLALRSYLRSLFAGDSETLLKFADASGSNRLTSTLQVNAASKGKNFYISSKILTHITVLLTAKTIVGENEYVLVFWRAQNETSPQSGPIAFQRTFFLHKKNNYLLTDDLKNSAFAAIMPIAHANGADLLPYPESYKILKQSAFPTNFYMIK